MADNNDLWKCHREKVLLHMLTLFFLYEPGT